jgi:NADH dehydrogenase
VILVVGGTGRLGSRVANRLARRGLPVRVLSRGTASAHPLDPGVEVVACDVRDPRAVDVAVRAATTVVSAIQGFVGPGGVSPRTVDRDGNLHLVAATERVGAELVLLSVLRAAADDPMELARMKYDAEQRLLASSCPWTVVRAEAFAQTWLEILEQTAGGSHRPLVFGDGVNPIAWVDVDDVAALVERAVVDPGLRSRVLEVAGPEPLGLEALARAVMASHGWAGTPRRIPRSALQVMSRTVGVVRPALGRQLRAALAMDRMPTVDCSPLRAELPDLPCTPVSTLLGRTAQGTVS